MRQMHHMTSMELEDEDKLDTMAAIPALPNADYPYGLRISLSEKEFEKLDLDHTVAEVGGMVHGHFMGRITSCSHDETKEGKHCRVEIQIEELAIDSEDEENEEEE